MKIGILTFHCAVNYGAVLQTYGLCQCLQRMGHEVYVIDYRPDFLIEPYKTFFPQNYKGKSWVVAIRKFVRELFAFFIRRKRNQLFSQFIHNNLHLDHLNLAAPDNSYDLFMFGSDQIWNKKITNFDPIFWGQAPAFEYKRMVAYAASAGSVKNIDKEDLEMIGNYLSRFSSISVREQQLANFLNEKFYKSCPAVLDPVLLAGRETFSKIAKDIHHAKPYLLCFSLSDNAEQRELAKKIAAKRGLDLIVMVSMTEYVSERQIIQNASVEEFIGLFKSADYVVTSSFHGTVFSILFAKEFIAFCNKDANAERIDNLLSDLGLKARLCSSYTDLQDKIDWNNVRRLLSEKQADSMAFLRKALA